MLGGLGTPRPPAEILPGTTRVITSAGKNVTSAFEQGARAVDELANAHNIRVAILKDGSPSCGSSFVYDGTFTRTQLAGEGITAAFLRNRGIAVFSEEELDAAERYVASLDQEDRSNG